MPEGVQAGGFAVHPALLDAVLQATDVSADPAGGPEGADAGAVRLPFAFGGVSVFAAGASLVRVRITPVADVAGDAVALEIADASGAPVASVESYVCRAMSAQAVGERVYRIDWVPAPITTPVTGSVAGSVAASASAPAGAAAQAAATPEFTRFDVPATPESSSAQAEVSADAGVPTDVPSDALSDAQAEVTSGAPSEGPSSAESSGAWAEAPSGVLSGMRSVAAGVLERVQEWVAVPEPVGPLVVVTRGAVGLPGEDVDVSVAPVWGLV
ncbi:polyketide synthase dehydratase domain-containing protein, partial [Microbispora amethystogenes]|uniref:polyketide synthase dehydratase domain-containing protein n=1 Tax=Microbispora amethystogenes TaxID=1427754 RepID=UPI0031F066E1